MKRRKIAALAGTSVAVFCLAGWVAWQGPGYPEIPTERLAITPPSETRADPLAPMGVVTLEAETATSLEISHEKSYPDRHPYFDLCQPDAEGIFRGKHASGKVCYVGTVYPSYREELGQADEFWPFQPHKLNGQPLEPQESESYRDILTFTKDQIPETRREREPPGTLFKRGGDSRFPLPQVMALLQWDETNPPRVNQTHLSATALRTGHGADQVRANAQGIHILGQADFMIWHEAAVRMDFTIFHPASYQMEIPFAKGAYVVEGGTAASVLGWVDGPASLELMEGDFEDSRVHFKLRRDEEAVTGAEVTTVALLTNAIIQAEDQLEAAVLTSNRGWLTLQMDNLRSLMALRIPTSPEKIHRLRLRWMEAGATRVVVDIPRLPGTPEINRGVRDFTRLRLPLDVNSLERDEAEFLMYSFFQAAQEEGPHFPSKYDEWGIPYPKGAADWTVRPAAPGRWMTGADLLRRWDHLAGNCGVRVKNGGETLLLGPPTPWEDARHWVKEKTGW